MGGVSARLKDAVQKMSARLGYPVIPAWRLERFEQTEHLARLFKRTGIDCVLDVGANIGQFREFLRLFLRYGGAIVSFEPVRELYERVERLARADPNWTAHQIALGDVSSSAVINVFAERTLSSFLERDEQTLREMGYEKYLRETELARTEEVPVRRLDEVFDEYVPDPNARVFLKSDTQGFDMNVIRGATGCLDRIAALQIELSIRHVYKGAPSYMEALRELGALGFEITGMFPVQRDPQLRVVNFDCVMINSRVAASL
jgi:FkbM family methyltransferase